MTRLKHISRAYDRWMDAHQGVRIAKDAAALFLILLLLDWTNGPVGFEENITRVQPFLLSFIAGCLIVYVFWRQSPGPRKTEPWWRFWKWVEPVVVGVALFILANAAYDFLLYSGFAKRFDVPSWAYTVSRFALAVSSFIVALIMRHWLWRIGHPQKGQEGEGSEYVNDQLP